MSFNEFVNFLETHKSELVELVKKLEDNAEHTWDDVDKALVVNEEILRGGSTTLDEFSSDKNEQFNAGFIAGMYTAFNLNKGEK